MLAQYCSGLGLVMQERMEVERDRHRRPEKGDGAAWSTQGSMSWLALGKPETAWHRRGMDVCARPGQWGQPSVSRGQSGQPYADHLQCHQRILSECERVPRNSRHPQTLTNIPKQNS